jgi:sugar phosphate isomerase/epimerase
MKIGICTTDFPVQTIEMLFERIQSLGISPVQFSFATIGEDDIPVRIPAEMIRQIRSAISERQVEITAINGTFNMIAPDIIERKQGIGRFEALADACRKLDCSVLSLCTGTRSRASMWQWHPDNATDEAWNDLLESIRPIIAIAEQYQIDLGVETEASNVVSSPGLARRFLDEINSPRLKIIMDCANLFHENEAWPENVRPVIKNAFDLLGRDIIIAHGKDIQASPEIVFASPGKGIVDYDYFLDLLKLYGYRGNMFLHGIKDEAEIPSCIGFMRQKLMDHGLWHDSEETVS